MTDSSPNNKKSPADTWKNVLNSGDIIGIIEEFHKNSAVSNYPDRHIEDIVEVVQKLAVDDIDGLIDQTFRQSIATATDLLLRSEINIKRALNKVLGAGDLHDIRSLEKIQTQLNQLEDQMEFFLRLATRYASIRHTLALGKTSKSALQSDVTPPKSDGCSTVTKPVEKCIA